MDKKLQVKFQKIIDKFAMELTDQEKVRLVYIFELPRKYYDEYITIVFQGLQMMGIYSIKNPEGLLDIAEVLEREDLKMKLQSEIQQFKRQTRLRRTSSAFNIGQIFDNVDLGPSLEIATKQIELARDSSELLRKMCKHRFRNEQEKYKRLQKHFDGILTKLSEAVNLLTLAGEEALDKPNLPIPATEDREEEEIKVYTEDIQETTNNVLTSHGGHLSPTHGTHLSPTHGTHLSPTHGAHPSPTHGAHPLPSHLGSNPPAQCHTRPQIPLLPPKDKTKSQVPNKKIPPPPPPKPKKLLSKSEQIDDPGYEIPDIGRKLDYTGSSTGDSGLGREGWPEPTIKKKEYQALLLVEESSGEYTKLIPPLKQNYNPK